MGTIRLNEKTLADLATPADQPQAYYWDTELVGLGVVVGRTGAKTFVARAWVNGKNRRVKIGVAGRPRPDGHPWSVALARAEANLPSCLPPCRIRRRLHPGFRRVGHPARHRI